MAILLEYQSIKNFWEKAVFPIALKRFLQLSKLKTLCRGYMLLVILKAKILLELFTKKNCKKQMKKKFRVKKAIKRKGDKLYVKWKGYDNSFDS